MFGCLGRLGCLVVALALAAFAYLSRDRWYPQAKVRLGMAPAVTVSTAPQWQALTADGAVRARAALAKLGEKNGPVYINVAPGDLASLVMDSVMHGISTAAGAEARAKDDRLLVRAKVSADDLGGSATLGPLASMFQGKQEVMVGGRLEILSPGHAQFRVLEVSLKELQLPGALIPRLVARISPKERDATVAADAIPFRTPRELSDVRVAKGRVTLYKSVP